MHQIFRTSPFPRVGNLDMVHNYLVNMLLLYMEYKDTAMTLDVCSIMWEELYTAVMDRKVPIYGPYLQVLFETAWAECFEDGRLLVGALTKHETVQLRIKDNWSGRHGPVQGSPAGSDEEIEEDQAAAGGHSVPHTRSGPSFGGSAWSSDEGPEQPGWAAKLTR